MNARTLAITALILCCTSHAAAQLVAEARWADTQYRFLDVSFTRKDNIVLDAFYVGVPGSNELTSAAATRSSTARSRSRRSPTSSPARKAASEA